MTAPIDYDTYARLRDEGVSPNEIKRRLRVSAVLKQPRTPKIKADATSVAKKPAGSVAEALQSSTATEDLLRPQAAPDMPDVDAPVDLPKLPTVQADATATRKPFVAPPVPTLSRGRAPEPETRPRMVELPAPVRVVGNVAAGIASNVEPLVRKIPGIGPWASEQQKNLSEAFEPKNALETVSRFGGSLYGSGALYGGLARMAGTAASRLSVPASNFLNPGPGASLGRRVAANVATSLPGDAIAAASTDGDLGDKVKAFGKNVAMDVAGATVFEGLNKAIEETPLPNLKSERGALGTGEPPEGPKGPGPEDVPSVPRETAPNVPVTSPEQAVARTDAAREYLNVPRFKELTPELRGVLEEKVLQTAARGDRMPKEVVPWKAVEEEGQQILAKDRGRLYKLDPQKMTGAESYATATLVQTNVQEAAQAASMFRTSTDPEELANAAKRLSVLDQETGILLDKLARGGSEAGRRLNAQKILAGLTDAPDFWVYRATQHAGRALDDVERSTIARYLNEGRKAEMLKYVGNLRQKGLSEAAAETWKAGLLTNPATHVVNMTGNTTMAVAEQIARQPAAAADWFLGKLGGAGIRTKSRGFNIGAKGLHEGWEQAQDVLKGLPVGDDLVYGVINTHSGTTGNAVLDAYNQTVFRLLGASDRIFNRVGFHSSLAEQASTLANTEGLKGAARKARIKELLSAPTDEMNQRAALDAMTRTFQDKTWLGKRLKSIAGEPGDIGNVVVPFTQTPGAVATRTAEYTPVGLFKGGVQGLKAAALIRKAVKNAKPITPELERMQQVAAETLGRGVVGTGLMAAGYYLYKNGEASGAYDQTDKGREQVEQLANVPNDGIKIPGTHYWVQPSRLGIPAMVMLMGAAIGQGDKEGGDVLARVGQGLGTYMRLLSDQPFFRGLSDVLDVTKDPIGAGSRYGTNLAGSVIPAGVAGLTRGTDDTYRESKGLGATMMSRIPGLSQKLPASYNQIGEASPRGAPGILNNLVLPFRVSRDRLDDPLIGDVYRSDASISRLKRQSGESNANYAKRSRIVGGFLKRQLQGVQQAPGYDQAAPDLRGEVFEKTARSTRGQFSRAAKEVYAAARDRGLSPAEAKAEVDQWWQERSNQLEQ